jgi:hypothetical protein
MPRIVEIEPVETGRVEHVRRREDIVRHQRRVEHEAPRDRRLTEHLDPQLRAVRAGFNAETRVSLWKVLLSSGVVVKECVTCTASALAVASRTATSIRTTTASRRGLMDIVRSFPTTDEVRLVRRPEGGAARR